MCLLSMVCAFIYLGMEGKSEGDDVTGDVTGDGELTDGDGDLLSRSQLSKRSKKSGMHA